MWSSSHSKDSNNCVRCKRVLHNPCIRPAPSLPLRTPPPLSELAWGRKGVSLAHAVTLKLHDYVCHCVGFTWKCDESKAKQSKAPCHAGHGLPVFPSPSQLLRACACVCGCARAILMSSPIAELPGCVRWRARLLCHAANQTGEVSHGQHRTWTACQKEAGNPRVTPHPSDLSDPHPALSELL
jgi:hypothetical protein